MSSAFRPASEPARTALHFLLIEDDDDHAEIVLRTVLRSRAGNTIDRVCNGEEGLAYLRSAGRFAGCARPDVVLLDLKLPGRDGHEILREIKGDAALRTIPVVMLTTSSAESDRRTAYANHANSYIVKPMSFSRFRQMVADLSLYWGVWSTPCKPQ